MKRKNRNLPPINRTGGQGSQPTQSNQQFQSAYQQPYQQTFQQANPQPAQPARGAQTQIDQMQQGNNTNYLRTVGIQGGGDTSKLLIRMQNRHIEDGAVAILVDDTDIANDDVALFDNKEINIKPPKVSEKITADNTEYYIESIHHDKFIRVKKEEEKKEDAKKEELKREEEKKASKSYRRKKDKEKQKSLKKTKEIEDKIFRKFDQELSAIINDIINFVDLFFLFVEGILAGISVLNIINFARLDVEGEDKILFIKSYSKNTLILYKIYFCLAFLSWVGNGIKSASAYQQYRILNDSFGYSDVNTLSKLKSRMIISGVFFVFFFIIFVLLVATSGDSEAFNVYHYMRETYSDLDYNYNVDGLDELLNPKYNLYKIFYLIINILCIILFLGYVIETAISPSMKSEREPEMKEVEESESKTEEKISDF